jgi:hypothetical protein
MSMIKQGEKLLFTILLLMEINMHIISLSMATILSYNITSCISCKASSTNPWALDKTCITASLLSVINK